LKRVSISEGSQPSSILQDMVGGPWAFGNWGDNDKIVFSTFKSGLFLVSANGDEFRTLTKPTDEAHNHPQWLPGGEYILFYTRQGDPTSSPEGCGDGPGAPESSSLSMAIPTCPYLRIFQTRSTGKAPGGFHGCPQEGWFASRKRYDRT
jgi:hypothetical protein